MIGSKPTFHAPSSIGVVRVQGRQRGFLFPRKDHPGRVLLEILLLKPIMLEFSLVWHEPDIFDLSQNMGSTFLHADTLHHRVQPIAEQALTSYKCHIRIKISLRVTLFIAPTVTRVEHRQNESVLLGAEHDGIIGAPCWAAPLPRDCLRMARSLLKSRCR